MCNFLEKYALILNAESDSKPEQKPIVKWNKKR